MAAAGRSPDAGLAEIASALAPAADRPARPGPLEVQTLDHLLVDRARAREVPVRLHLPAGEGPCPVIVFSHGLGGSRLGYGWLGRSWASFGYAVLHPTHPGSDTSLLRGSGLVPFRNLRAAMADPANWEARARDVSFLLDQLPALEQALPRLAGRLDASLVGVGGHSFGGYTAAALAGAQLWFPGEESPRPLADPRPLAFLAMSPPGYGERGLRPGSWSTIARPLFEITGTLDFGAFDGSPYELRLAPFADLPPGGKTLLVVDGADHLSFAGGTSSSPAREAQKALVEEATLAFWDGWLLGRAGALDRLTREALAVHGIGVRIEQR